MEKKKRNNILNIAIVALLCCTVCCVAITGATQSVAVAEYDTESGSLSVDGKTNFPIYHFVALSGDFNGGGVAYDAIYPVAMFPQFGGNEFTIKSVIYNTSHYNGQYYITEDVGTVHLLDSLNDFGTYKLYQTFVEVFANDTYVSTYLRYFINYTYGFDSNNVVRVFMSNKNDNPLPNFEVSAYASTFGYQYNYIIFYDINDNTCTFVWNSLTYSPGSDTSSPLGTWYSSYFIVDTNMYINNGFTDEYSYNVGYYKGFEQGKIYAVENELGKMDSIGAFFEWFQDALDIKILGFISIKDLLYIVLGVSCLGLIFKLLAV